MSMPVSRTVANFGVVLVSLAISFCGMTLGSLVAETACTLVYGNEGDAELSTLIFKVLAGIVLFLGMPIIFYIVRTAELVLHAKFSKITVYTLTLSPLLIGILLLVGGAFDYQWVIFFATAAIAWLIYSEAMLWLWTAPRRLVATLAIAGVGVCAAVVIPRLLFLLDLQPDWARHALAATILCIVLTLAVGAVIALDRRKRRLSLWRTTSSRLAIH